MVMTTVSMAAERTTETNVDGKWTIINGSAAGVKIKVLYAGDESQAMLDKIAATKKAMAPAREAIERNAKIAEFMFEKAEAEAVAKGIIGAK
jgi:hypothetical protein